MAITYDVPSNTITVTGMSELTPYDFQDIKDDNDTGGWGVVGKQGANQFHFDCHLELGITNGAAGWLADTLKEIEFGPGFEFNIRNTGHFRAGEIITGGEAGKITKDGCVIVTDFTSTNNYVRCYGEIEFYSSTLMNLDRSYGQLLLGPGDALNRIRLWNSKVSGLQYVREVGDWQEHEYNWFRANIENNDVGILMSTGIFPVEHMIDTVVLGCGKGVEITWLGYYAEDSNTVRNLNIKGATEEDIFVYNSGRNHPWAVYLIDAISDWTFRWTGTENNGQVNRQYTFNLHVVDEDGVDVDTARVRAWDKDDNPLFDVNTNANGVITEQIITYKHYKPARKLTLLLAGYANCVEADIGKQVKDDGVEVGALVSYDNITREWIVDTVDTIITGSVITITDGDGAGTSIGNVLEATSMMMESPHTLKITKDEYNDLDVIWDMTEPVEQILTLTHPSHPVSEYAYALDYPMSWSEAANTITVWGDDGSGGKTPMGWEDNIDTAINFDKVWKFARAVKGTTAIGDKYVFNCKLRIGKNGIETYFIDVSKSIIILDGVLSGQQSFIEIDSNTMAVFGELISGIDKTCWKGCSFDNQNTVNYSKTFHIATGYSNAKLYIYSSMLKNTGDGSSTNIKWAVQNEDNLDNVFRIWDSIADGGFVQGSTDACRLTHKKTSHGFYKPSGSIDDILIYNNYRGAVSYNPPAEITFRNLVLRNNTYSIRGYGLDEDAFFIDCIMDNWNILWEGSGNTHRFYRQYTFNLMAIDKDKNGIGGAKVVLRDKDGIIIFDTDTASPIDWWNIPGKNCPEHLDDVAPYTVAITDDSDDWTISLRTHWNENPSQYAYDARYGRVIIGLIGSSNGIYINGTYYNIGLFAAGMHSYSVVSNGTHIQCYRDGATVGTPIASAVDIGGAKRWASRYNDTYPWGAHHNKVCFHTEELDGAQVAVLHTQMDVEVGETGTINEQTVSYGYYDYSHGSELQNYSPHELTIQRQGYETYKKLFTFDEETNCILALRRSPYSGRDAMGREAR